MSSNDDYIEPWQVEDIKQYPELKKLYKQFKEYKNN